MAEAAPDQADAGFTLVETLVAGTLVLLLVLPAMEILSRTYRFVGGVQSRARQSQEARQVLGLLGDGTAEFGMQANPRGFRMVEGLRGRKWDQLPANWYLPQNWPLRGGAAPGQFVMTDGIPKVVGDAAELTDVACTGAGAPIPDCTGVEVRSVQGWLGADPQLAQVGRTISVGIAITDPFQARRRNPDLARITETFRTLFTVNVEQDP